MAGVIINFPGCGVVNSNKDQESQVITVTTDGCMVDPSSPPLIPWWSWVLGAAILVVFIISASIVRFRRQERLESENDNKAKVELAKAQAKTTSCPTCGTVYVPEGKK